MNRATWPERAEADGRAGEGAGVRGREGEGGPCHRSTDGRCLPARAEQPQDLVRVSASAPASGRALDRRRRRRLCPPVGVVSW